MTSPAVPTEGVVVVDKPAGLTSHDVVARVRRLAGTRRVGHAGTLDPMATGVLIVGLGRATRLLGHLARGDKEYEATIRLGASTDTDDAEGEIRATSTGSWSVEEARVAMARLTGDIQQVPPAYSAIKVAGRRAYAKARAGEEVALPPRTVTVIAFELLAAREAELDVHIVCSTGTYVRSLARDLGAALGVGGHLSALRRTRVGPFRLGSARTLEQLAERLDVVPLAAAVASAFPRRNVAAEEVPAVLHGGRLSSDGAPPGPVGVFGPDGAVLALVEDRDGVARPLCVFS